MADTYNFGPIVPALMDALESKVREASMEGDRLRAALAKAQAFAEACDKATRDYKFELEETQRQLADCQSDLEHRLVSGERNQGLSAC